MDRISFHSMTSVIGMCWKEPWEGSSSCEKKGQREFTDRVMGNVPVVAEVVTSCKSLGDAMSGNPDQSPRRNGGKTSRNPA